MTYPVFASGDVLNASDMNAVGLWLIKEQTIGTTVSSVTVTSAFSADYDNYWITVNGGAGTATADLSLKLGATTTGYYSTLVYGVFSTNTITALNNNNGSSFSYAGFNNTNEISASFWVFSPFATVNTRYYAPIIQNNTTGVAGQSGGFVNNNTSYTEFTLTTSIGTLTGGTIRVYGLRG